MRAVPTALCIICLSYASAATAEEADLSRFAYASRPVENPLTTFDLGSVPAIQIERSPVGPLRIVPSYSVDRSGESWRVPESGQFTTTQEVRFSAYLKDHPFVRVGVHALMRTGTHDDSFDSTDPNSLHRTLGHEPDEHKYMVDLVVLYKSLVK